MRKRQGSAPTQTAAHKPTTRPPAPMARVARPRPTRPDRPARPAAAPDTAATSAPPRRPADPTAPPPSRWRRMPLARPAEILSAALEAVVDNGFAATRLEDVAQRA